MLAFANARYSRAGRVPFSFSYREAPTAWRRPGGYVRRHRRWHGGALEYSFAVDPLKLPHYSGTAAAAVAVYASAYVHSLERTNVDFRLRGEGKTLLTKTLAGLPGRATRRSSKGGRCTGATSCCCRKRPARAKV